MMVWNILLTSGLFFAPLSYLPSLTTVLPIIVARTGNLELDGIAESGSQGSKEEVTPAVRLGHAFDIPRLISRQDGPPDETVRPIS